MAAGEHTNVGSNDVAYSEDDELERHRQIPPQADQLGKVTFRVSKTGYATVYVQRRVYRP